VTESYPIKPGRARVLKPHRSGHPVTFILITSGAGLRFDMIDILLYVAEGKEREFYMYLGSYILEPPSGAAEPGSWIRSFPTYHSLHRTDH
jgi:hypothetical protein